MDYCHALICFVLQIPLLKDRLRDKERQLADIASNATNSNVAMTSSWHQAMSEAKRQYEAIDGALEVKMNIEIVAQSLIDCLYFHHFVDITQYSEHREGMPAASKDAT